MDKPKFVNLELWSESAIVLFDRLQSIELKDTNTVAFTHKAQKQALADLLSQLEQSIKWPEAETILRAQREVSKDMGWE